MRKKGKESERKIFFIDGKSKTRVFFNYQTKLGLHETNKTGEYVMQKVPAYLWTMFFKCIIQNLECKKQEINWRVYLVYIQVRKFVFIVSLPSLYIFSFILFHIPDTQFAAFHSSVLSLECILFSNVLSHMFEQYLLN